MSTTPYMGLSLPVPSSSSPDWGGLLNTAFSLLDSHDHTAGHGIQVPSAGININADLPFNGFNLTQARTLRLQQQAAAPALAQDAGAIYCTTAGDLWYNNGAGQHVQITSGSALSAASLGGISGLGGTSAGVAFNNATKTFAFTQAANQGALLDAGPLVIRDTAASAFGITLQSPVGIAGAYALTLPTALPGSNALLSLGTSGVLSAFGTVSGNNLTLLGTLSLATAGATIIANTATDSGLLIEGNKAAATSTTDADVKLSSTATRTAGYLAAVVNNGANKLLCDFQGLLTLGAQAAPLQPAGLWTAITPNTNIAASAGLAYWKDPLGIVHLKGLMQNNTGGATNLWVTTSPLPVGFRPTSIRIFAAPESSIALGIIIGTDGSITTSNGTAPSLFNLSLDGINFLAEA